MRFEAFPRVSVECVGEAYIAFHHGTGATHVLSDVAVLVLRALQKCACEVEDVVAAVSAELDLESTLVAPSVSTACDELLGVQLLKVM